MSDDERAALTAEMATRVEVIDTLGRAFVGYYGHPGMTVYVQDEGRTLKVIVSKA